MKKIAIKALTLSAIIPALYLLALTLFFLPSFLSDILYDFSLSSMLVPTIMIFGIFGFVGLTLQLATDLFSKLKLKIIFQSLGILAFVGFLTFVAGKNSWTNLLNFTSDFNNSISQFFCYVWPNLVCLILISINIIIIKNRNFC